jgi:hypothetical protein
MGIGRDIGIDATSQIKRLPGYRRRSDHPRRRAVFFKMLEAGASGYVPGSPRNC